MTFDVYLHWEALDALPNAGDVSKWPPPVQLDVTVVLRFQHNIADDTSTAGGVRASSEEINKQPTTNDSRMNPLACLPSVVKKRKQQQKSFLTEP